jgi:signal peptidase I
MTAVSDASPTGNVPPEHNRPRSPWLSIWFSPGETIDWVTSRKAWLSVLLLGGIGVPLSLTKLAIDRGWLTGPADWPTFAALVLAAFVFGVVILFFNAFMVKLLGLPLGGRAPQAHLRAALAWGSVPATFGLAVSLAWIIGLKLTGADSSPPLRTIVALVSAATVWVMALWTLVITVAAVKRVQHFGIGRAIANVAIGWFMGGVLVAIVIRTFVLQPFNIPAASMVPTLLVGDYLFVSKYAYGYSHFSLPFSPPLFAGRILPAEPQRGDVVVFRLPKDSSTDYVKRLVGLPGDRIQMKDGVLIINDVPVKRERVDDFIDEDNGEHVRRWRETLPNGISYFAIDLQDNGFLDNTQVYTVPPGHYFMLGDNLDNSADSRVLSAVGYVPFENLIGRAEFIFFSIRQAGGRGPAIRSERIGRMIR